MKKELDDLAILGGPRTFERPLHVGRPNIGDRKALFARLTELLDAHWLTNNGPCLELFEERLRERLGARHCVAVANGTLGLMLAAQALGFRDEVILPAFTFVGSAHALAWQGLTPVFCDIDPQSFQIDPRAVEPLITSRTSGILGVHLFGGTCDVQALERIARQRGLKLLIDAAHAVGCSFKDGPIGGRGDAAVFSFHATKIANSFEGGVIATNDESVAEKVRHMRNFGFSDEDKVDCIGINAKLSEPAAAMGIVSLESLDEFISVNRSNYDAYRRVLAGIPGISLLPHDRTGTTNFHYLIIEVEEGPTGMSRDLLQATLRKENVLTRRYFYPGCHRLEPYASLPRWREALLPITDHVASRVLALPTGTAISELDIESIGGIVRLAMTHGHEIARKMTSLQT